MLYNQTKVNGAYMPLLLGCVKPSQVKEVEPSAQHYYYDPLKQVLICGPKYHSTMSQKPEITDPGHHQDWKTRQDDKKFY